MRWSLILALICVPAVAVGDDPGDITLDDLREVESLRKSETLLEAPVAISSVDREEITRAKPGVDLEEALELVPGVFPQSSRNFAQDTRVSIRGFGSRAPFGIRGIKVMTDGVPNTLPDGQTEVDSIDLAFIDRLEVVRSPISSLYGGGAGGLLSLYTSQPTEEPTFNVRTLFGTDHLSRYEAMARGGAASTGYVLGFARTRFSGYRDHSRAEQNAVLGKLSRTFGKGTKVSLNFYGVWAPEGQDPGGLRKAEVNGDRKQAAPNNLTFDAGEKLNQQKIALLVRHPLGPSREIQLMTYTLRRNFSNQLPFTNGGQVRFDRNVSGGALTYSDAFGPIRWMWGTDVDVQQDNRRRYNNLPGGVRGALTVSQYETVRSVGPFAEASYESDWGLSLVAGARYDWIEFVVDDRFSADGDQSDRIRFRELSPRFGASYTPLPGLFFYGNISTAFQVPTTTELRPSSGVGGFDSDRDPERTLSFEIGSKGVFWDRLFFDVALFALKVRDILVPFETIAQETFWRNAGEAHRQGVEATLAAELLPGLSVRAAYTYARYYYHDYDTVVCTGPAPCTPTPVSFDDNDEPNNARHSLGGELRWNHPRGAFAVLSLRHFSRMETNDANTASSGGTTISDARLGYDWIRNHTRIRPFLGLRNWTGRKYNGTLRPNAGFGRYYEPAPERQLYGGLEIEFVLAD
jgi:iron complex outermembrane receptor protein